MGQSIFCLLRNALAAEKELGSMGIYCQTHQVIPSTVKK
jgi:hypothetical protein